MYIGTSCLRMTAEGLFLSFWNPVGVIESMDPIGFYEPFRMTAEGLFRTITFLLVGNASALL